jgi:hypothetical protein
MRRAILKMRAQETPVLAFLTLHLIATLYVAARPELRGRRILG